MSPLDLKSHRELGRALRFFLYGLVGWCIEVMFTAVYNQVDGTGDLRLMGHSYLWMHPIWASGLLLCEELGNLMRRHGFSMLGRGVVYVAICYAVEASSGAVLEVVTGAVPWDYSASPWHVRGLIRLDYAPLWAVCGWTSELLGQQLRRVRLLTPEGRKAR